MPLAFIPAAMAAAADAAHPSEAESELEPRCVLLTGCMYSGKSTELRRLADEARTAGRRVCVVRCALNTRDHGSAVAQAPTSIEVEKGGGATMLLRPGDEAQLLRVDDRYTFDDYVMDEVQFYPVDYSHAGVLTLPGVVRELFLRGRSLLLAGLSGTYHQQQWPCISQLVPLCTEVRHLRADCSRCRRPDAAVFSCLRNTALWTPEGGAGHVAQVGGVETYEVLCPRCHRRESDEARGFHHSTPSGLPTLLGMEEDEAAVLSFSGEW